MTEKSPKVDGFLRYARKWQAEMTELRRIALDCDLSEGLKWGKPCYMFEEHNIVLIQGFKDYFAFLFFKGALLKDPKGILQKMGESTQAGRQARFTSMQEMIEKQSILKKYIREAIEVEKAGLKVTLKKISEYPVPEEFEKKLEEMPALRAAFEALTPGRQRLYLVHFSSAKQSRTRESRIEKCLPQILGGKGLND
jgi:uncharacterized protein YdeI (YjbR/CyaY-like superfamily)